MNKESIYTRTEMMLGSEAIERLRRARVIVFGVGGVGGHAVEVLVRAGVGAIALVDPDRVGVTNLNRQLIATERTVGRLKVEAMRDRIAEINPECRVECYPVFFGEDNAELVPLDGYDYIIDAIDSVTSKVFLIARASELSVPIVSSMGAGNKLDPTRFRVGDIFSTSHDPLAKAVRTRLRLLGIRRLKVVWSDEDPVGRRERGAPGSISFVPGVVGMILGGEVVKDIAFGASKSGATED